jgi:hypothetical protein
MVKNGRVLFLYYICCGILLKETQPLNTLMMKKLLPYKSATQEKPNSGNTSWLPKIKDVLSLNVSYSILIHFKNTNS